MPSNQRYPPAIRRMILRNYRAPAPPASVSMRKEFPFLWCLWKVAQLCVFAGLTYVTYRVCRDF
jgi:hypothetical protein